MRVDVVTIFPDYLAPLQLSLLGRAQRLGLLDLHVHDLRGWTEDRHRTVDDTPAGGGAGMVMLPEPWGLALDAVHRGEGAGGPVGAAPTAEPGSDAGDGAAVELAAAPDEPADGRPLLLVPSPSGRRLDQAMAHELAREPRLVVACGRYEGIDERVLLDAAQRYRVVPFSLGDYVLNGGEVAALALVEAVGRLLPGVVGNPASLLEESHEQGLLEHPVYTRPPRWRGLDVPDVLLSGHHGQVARWRRDEGLRRTARRRPDLLEALAAADPGALDRADLAVLAEEGWVPGGRRPAAPSGD
ncbi:tRNA (guanosine(37)-N1)-methyltransferase TrmD [uncultured Pseudokineococcus sp.]|uniref:tRNA (guanosine(37)-N1)-methyltransferase TrmD n=1 Tax=uncultured Pseudokineococcus sp. TaxID=1642928 RepID=UPI002621BE2A|nr:tRNA (guanosine(37)-N1)-methyltransferase TrmD [uncultured Pseudokineococcus sp.]